MRFYLPLKLQNMKKKKQLKKLTDLIGKGIDIQESKKSTKLKEEQFFFDVLTSLCQLEAKSQIIMWWVFESINPEGEISTLVDENQKHHLLKTPEELYKFLKRYDEK